jgi:hypothetical protein
VHSHQVSGGGHSRRSPRRISGREEIRVFLLLVFVMLLVALGVLFFVGTLFIQSFIFTEATEGLAWRAPTAAAIMAVFFTLWCLIVVRSDATPGNIPYTTIFNFSTRVNMLSDSAEQLWAERYDKKVTRYVRTPDIDLGKSKWHYQSTSDTTKSFTPVGVESVEIESAPGVKTKFMAKKDGDSEFFQSDDGWNLEYDRDISGNPYRMSWALIFGNLLLNGLHFALWFVCLWLILRFSMSSSVLFAAILWGLVTVALLPMLLEQAASYH